MSKNKNFIALAVLAVLIIGSALLFKGNPSETAGDQDVVEVKDDETTVSGVIACLPYRISVIGQECVKGIKGDDGKVYALNVVTPLAEGAKVTAIGTFEPANTSVDDSSVFAYDGVLVVRSLVRR